MKKYQILLFAALLFVLSGFGQQSKIDSLEVYYHYSVDEKRMDICLQLSNLYRNINPLRGLEYAYEGLSLSRQINEKQIEGRILNEIGVLFRKLGDFKKAIIYHHDALCIFQNLEDQMGIAFCFSNIANVNVAMGNYDMALEYAKRSLVIKEKLKNKYQIAYTDRIIAQIYHESGRFSEAMPYYARALEYYSNLDNWLEKANVMLNIAILFSSLDEDYSSAQVDSLYNRSQELYEMVGSKYGIAAVQYYRANWEFENKRYSVAEHYYLNALECSKNLNAKTLYIKTLNSLSAFYASINEKEKAYDYLRQYNTLQEEVFSEKTARDIADIQARILFHEQEKEISRLQKDKRIKNILIGFVVTVLVLLLIILFAFSRRYSVSKKLNKKLNQEIHNRKISEEKLQLSEKQLKGLLRDKNRFLNILSHDLRSPFGGIYGLLYVLDEQYDELNEPQRKEIIDRLLISSEQLNNLLEDFLSYTSISSGKIILKISEMALSPILSEIIELNDLRLQSKNISSSYYCGAAKIKADYHMLKTVLLNLMSNAIKFSHRGSSIEVHCEEKNDKVLISVQDHGVGMNEDLVKQIRQHGKQISRPGTAGEKGSGIGLLLVCEILEMHGSSLIINSMPGEGTEMSFYLPKA